MKKIRKKERKKRGTLLSRYNFWIFRICDNFEFWISKNFEFRFFSCLAKSFSSSQFIFLLLLLLFFVLSQTWTSLAFPNEIASPSIIFMSAIISQGLLYVFASKTAVCYNPQTDKWGNVCRPPTPPPPLIPLLPPLPLNFLRRNRIAKGVTRRAQSRMNKILLNRS